MNLCASENSAVMLLGFSSRNHHRAIPSAQMRTFGLLARPQASGRVANRVLDSESLIHMDSYHGMDAVVKPGFSGYTIGFQ